MQKQAPRHYCACCTRRKSERKMAVVRLPYTMEEVWVCMKCFGDQPQKVRIIRLPYGLFDGSKYDPNKSLLSVSM
jgi:hypothetical protein